MPPLAPADVTPIVTAHGETVYELLGRASPQTSDRHSVALVTLPPGKASLLHYHPDAEESYIILRGQARLRLGNEEMYLEAGQTVLIPAPQPHKIWNIGSDALEFMAVCVPAWEPTNSVFLE